MIYRFEKWRYGEKIIFKNIRTYKSVDEITDVTEDDMVVDMKEIGYYWALTDNADTGFVSETIYDDSFPENNYNSQNVDWFRKSKIYIELLRVKKLERIVG